MERASSPFVEAAALQLPSLQSSLASLQAGLSFLGAQKTRVICTVRENRAAAVAVATAAAGVLAFALVLRHYRQQQQRKLGDDSDDDDDEEDVGEACSITSLVQLREYCPPLLGASPVTAVCVTQQGVQLSVVPRSVWALHGLRELDLRNNAITAVPATLGSLTALTR